MENHGTDPRRRMAMMAERIDAMKAIWTEDEASYHGEYVNFDRIWSWPKPAQWPHPPVLVGGNGPTVLDRVLAFGDAWMPNYIPGEDLAARIAELRARADRPIDVGDQRGAGQTGSARGARAPGRAAGRPLHPLLGDRARREARSTAGRPRSPNCTGSDVERAQARERFARARSHAWPASVPPAGRTSCRSCSPLEGETIYSVVDAKPKRTTRPAAPGEPARAARGGRCSSTTTTTDWSAALVGARGRSSARVLDPPRTPRPRAPLRLLAARYPQQRAAGAVLAIDVERWSGWSAAESA